MGGSPRIQRLRTAVVIGSTFGASWAALYGVQSALSFDNGRESTVIVESDDGTRASGVVVEHDGHWYAVTARSTAVFARVAHVHVIERDGAHTHKASFPAEVLWSESDRGFAILDLDSAKQREPRWAIALGYLRKVRPATILGDAELRALPGGSKFLLWGALPGRAGDAASAELVAMSTRYVGRDDATTWGAGHAARRGPIALAVDTPISSGAFSGAPAFDERGRLVGIESGNLLVSAEEIRKALDEHAGGTRIGASSSPTTEATASAAPVPQNDESSPSIESLVNQLTVVRNLLSESAPVWERLWEPRIDTTDQDQPSLRGKKFQEDLNKIADQLPDPRDYLAPSDFSSLLQVLIRDPWEHKDPMNEIKVRAYHHMTEVLTRGGANHDMDFAHWSISRVLLHAVPRASSPADAGDSSQELEALPGTYSFVDQIQHDDHQSTTGPQISEEQSICLVREHGRMWISIFKCEPSDNAGHRRNLLDHVARGWVFDHFVGRWRLARVHGSVPSYGEKEKCQAWIRSFDESSRLEIFRAQTQIKATLDFSGSLFRPPGGRCPEAARYSMSDDYPQKRIRWSSEKHDPQGHDLDATLTFVFSSGVPRSQGVNNAHEKLGLPKNTGEVEGAHGISLVVQPIGAVKVWRFPDLLHVFPTFTGVTGALPDGRFPWAMSRIL